MERRDVAEADPHELARDLRLQEFGRVKPITIAEPLVEPAWLGPRVVAAVADDRATLWWEGEPFDERPEVSSALARATGQSVEEGAIFEALPHEATRPGRRGHRHRRVDGDPDERDHEDVHRGTPRPRGRIRGTARRRTRGADFEPHDVVNVVLVDLLWLDGQWLLDVPLLERKRVLESIVPPERLVRPSPFVREPLGSWIGSWRAQGFRAMSFKAANSRYRPGETADDWTLADLPHR